MGGCGSGSGGGTPSYSEGNLPNGSGDSGITFTGELIDRGGCSGGYRLFSASYSRRALVSSETTLDDLFFPEYGDLEGETPLSVHMGGGDVEGSS